MKALKDTNILFGRSMRHILRSPDTIITVAITPIAIMLLFVYVLGGAIETNGGSYVDYVLPGILLMAIASGISYTAMRLFSDQALQAALNKQSSSNRKTPEQIDAAIRQLVSKAITTEGQVIDVFTAAGLPKPDISILSDQFLAEVRGLKHKNVAAELLEKLLKDELKVRSKHNLVQSQIFSEKLKKTLNAYHNRAISTMQVIEELIKLAKDLDAATKAGKEMGLTDDEKAFYDALSANDSAVTAMGDAKLKVIAAELITQVKKSVTIDWTLRESARAKIKIMVKRILNKYGYPPDLQEEAVKTVLAQAELLCAEWV